MSALSIIIPCLNAAGTLGPVLDAVADPGQAPPDVEVIIVDGGSDDGTTGIAEGRGALVVHGARGRGIQLRTGVAAAAAPWLLLLHADTRLDPGWRGVVTGFMADPANRQRAAAFRLRLDSPHPSARRVERLVAWRARRLGLPWGDQGLLIHRDMLAGLGGVPDQPLMEDVALVRKIGRKRLVLLDVGAMTSSARYERDGWLRRPLRNQLLLLLYFAGVSPRVLARLYG
mgnify:CR=1 FL=1